ncbi:hypothetical protein GCM10025772_05290 [Ferrimonas gelatinilytica]|uniref:Uncharacterized protein n=1 Tax=Ferrimonas gelatinilytica TaxID=1255257 RepID=A0ABP9RUM3_9GAMM
MQAQHPVTAAAVHPEKPVNGRTGDRHQSALGRIPARLSETVKQQRVFRLTIRHCASPKRGTAAA